MLKWTTVLPPSKVSFPIHVPQAFVACAYAAARICYGRELLAIIAVCLVGWAVFFYEAGGLSGMLGAGFPLWYEFFPSHVIAALIAFWLVRRRQS